MGIITRRNFPGVGWQTVAVDVDFATFATAAVWVSKFGDDSNDGLDINRPELTIGAAVDTADALLSAGAPKVAITILDGGIYSEDVALGDNMVLVGISATVEGAITLGPGAEAHLDRHFAVANDTIMVDALTTTGETSHYSSRVTDGRGLGGALTGVTLIRNRTSGRILFAEVGVGFVGQDGYGIHDAGVGAGFGHIHFLFKDVYLAGNSAAAIRANNANTNLIGYLDHILEYGSPTGTVGVSVNNAAAVAKVTCSEIIADEVWNISAGALHISCPKLTGTRTGAATILIDGLSLGADVVQTGTAELGFYGTSPIPQQTGVGVNAAAIHAALVNLGLITA